MAITNVIRKVDSFWLSKGIKPIMTENGYYFFEMKKWKLYIYPEDLGATFMVIPTSRKYQIYRNLNIETDIGLMHVDANPNRSNPALLFGVSESDLNVKYIDKVISYMVSIVENQFDLFQKHQ